MKRIRKVLFLIVILSMFSGSTVRAGRTESDLEVPEEVIRISEELGEQYCICPELIQAICWKESRFQPDAENDGCVGIMQIYQKWHRGRMERLGVTQLTDIRQNMLVGVDYLSEILEKEEDIANALMVYHGESDADKKSIRGEMSDYANNILEISAELERRNGK